MKRILSLAIVAFILAACETPAILRPDPNLDPCGVGGPICDAKTCCPPHYVCGHYFDGSPDYLGSWCKAGQCCPDQNYRPGPDPIDGTYQHSSGDLHWTTTGNIPQRSR